MAINIKRQKAKSFPHSLLKSPFRLFNENIYENKISGARAILLDRIRRFGTSPSISLHRESPNRKIVLGVAIDLLKNFEAASLHHAEIHTFPSTDLRRLIYMSEVENGLFSHFAHMQLRKSAEEPENNDFTYLYFYCTISFL